MPSPATRRLSIILTIVLLAFLCSAVFHYEVGARLGRPYPENTFLFRPLSQFSDYYNNFAAAEAIGDLARDKTNVIAGMGSATLMLYAWLLYGLVYPFAVGSFLWLSLLLFLAALLFLVRRSILRVSDECVWPKTLALTLFTYPVLLCLDRANTEIFIFLLLTAAVFSIGRNRFDWAAVALGLVIAVKPYAVVFIPLFIPERQFKAAFSAVALAVLLTLFSLWILPGKASTAIEYLRQSLATYHQQYALENEGLYFGSSLWGMVKVVIFWIKGGVTSTPSEIDAILSRAMAIYFYFAAFAFGAIAMLISLVRMRLWQSATLVVCSMNLLPFVCGDYRLVHLFIPLLLFVQEEKMQTGDRFFAAVFGLLLIPTSYVHFSFDPVFQVNPGEVSDSVILHPVLMVALAGGVIIAVLRRRESSELLTWGRRLLGYTDPVGVK